MTQIWTKSQRAVLISLLILLLAIIIYRYSSNPIYPGMELPTPAQKYHQLETRLDPNTAPWQALAAIPTLSEKIARQIVAYRQQFVSEHPGQLPFRSPQDLDQVKGIGPATIDAISPHLIFPTPPTP